MKVDWLVWFPLTNTPPNKLRHPDLVCSQDVLLAFDPFSSSFYHSWCWNRQNYSPTLFAKQTNLPFLWERTLQSVSLYHPLPPPDTQSSGFGNSTSSSFLIPVNPPAPPPKSQSLHHIFSSSNQGAKHLHKEHSGPHRGEAANPLNTRCFLGLLHPGCQGWLAIAKQSPALITAWITLQREKSQLQRMWPRRWRKWSI